MHGGSARWQAFQSILEDLATTWHIYAPDFRRHGQSDWAPGTYRLQDYCTDTIHLLQQVLTKPAYLFGHSLGGMVALLVAAQYPAGVRAVAVGDAPLSSHHWQRILQQGAKRLTAWRTLSGGQTPLAELIEVMKDTPVELPDGTTVPMREAMGESSPVFTWLATNLYQQDPDMLNALLERFGPTAAGYTMATVLPAIRSPVLLLQADPTRGGVMTDEEVTQALSLLVHPSHVQLPGVSHVLHNERPDLVVAALRTFFARY